MGSIAVTDNYYYNHCHSKRLLAHTLAKCYQRCLKEKCSSFSHARGDVCIINDCFKQDTNPSIKADKGFKYTYYELV